MGPGFTTTSRIFSDELCRFMSLPYEASPPSQFISGAVASGGPGPVSGARSSRPLINVFWLNVLPLILTLTEPCHFLFTQILLFLVQLFGIHLSPGRVRAEK